jgi:hypothetical protein
MLEKASARHPVARFGAETSESLVLPVVDMGRKGSVTGGRQNLVLHPVP